MDFRQASAAESTPVRWRTLTLLASAGCAANPPLFVPAESGTVLLIAVPSVGTPQARVIDTRVEGAQSLTLALEGDLELFAFHYTVPADALGLPLGTVTVRSDGAGRKIPEETSRTLRASAVRQGVQGEWTVVTAPPERVAALTLDIATRCIQLGVQTITFDAGTGVETYRLVIPAGGDDVVMIGYSGAVYRVGPTGSSVRNDVSGVVPIAGGMITEDGTLWLMSPDGRLASGTLESGIRTMHARLETTGSHVIRMDGVSGPGGTELFAWTSQGVLAKFDGTGWTRLSTAASENALEAELDLVRVGPDEALAVRSLEPPTLLHYRRGRVEEIDLGRGFARYVAPRAMALVPELGVVTALAELIGPADIEVPHFRRLSDGSWSTMEGVPPTVHLPRVIAPSGRASFLFGGFRGNLLQHHDGDWSCPEIVFDDDFTWLVPIAHGYAAIPDGIAVPNRYPEIYLGLFP